LKRFGDSQAEKFTFAWRGHRRRVWRAADYERRRAADYERREELLTTYERGEELLTTREEEGC
jgi:hypothetical protein